uniref:Ribonuclease H-like domain-containing protein n=1 Tax=Tanacetum cinerariifolium TaxID=118510 RepID=A0A6L2K2Z1_TANCI|nr:ribonuclease H-like domain-containing protein [Tanacetum cinerariifolium]
MYQLIIQERFNDEVMFDVNDDLRGEKVFVDKEVPLKEVLNVVEEVVVEITTAGIETTSAKPKADKVMIQEPEQGITITSTTTTAVTAASTRPKAKRIVMQEPKLVLEVYLCRIDMIGPWTFDFGIFLGIDFDLLGRKDETSGILKSFITGIENLVDHKVKVIRCGNRTEFKNKEMNQFCEMKGILRQFSVARTYQQNGVAERRNMTLIEASRTMLADTKLPTILWAEAVNTACYVQNRVLVVKPHNKASYELFHDRTPTLSFMRPFGCLVTIINTIDHLGKFDGKADEGTKASDNAGQARKETEPVKNYILLPLWTADLPFSQDLKSYHDDGSKPLSDDGKKVDEDPRKENECNDQEKENNVNSTNNVNIVSLTVNTAGTDRVNAVDDGAVADMNNLDTTIQVEPKKVIHALKDPSWIEAIQEELLQFKLQEELCIAFEKLMHEKFQMSSIGELTFFLGLQVKQKKDGIIISQDKYVAEILKKFGFTEVKTASTHIETQKPLLKDEDGEEVDVHMYRSMIGSLMYLTSLRPDIMFAVCACARYQVNPKVSHLHVVKRIFSMIRNLDNVSGKILIYPRNMRRAGKGFSGKVIPLFQTMVQQLGEDEAVHKELGDKLVKAATTASSLEAEQNSGGLRCQETMGDTINQTRFKSVSKHSNDSLLVRGNTLQSDEDSLKLDELMALCITLQNKVLDLEKTTTTQHNEIASLKRRVKKLKKKNSSRTHGLKRLYKVGLSTRVESSGDEESLGEDASKHRRRINAIDVDEDITLVNASDNEMFDIDVSAGEEEFVAGQNKNVVEEVVNAAQDKGKGKMIEEPMKPKKKDQIRLDEKAAKKLQAEFVEKERLAREKYKKEERVNIALIEEWDDIQAKIDKALAAKKAEEKMNKPPIKAQQRKIMCTYLKNMEGYKLKDLKLKESNSIQEMFDRAFKRQKVEDDKEKAELKQLMETILDEEEVVIDAIPLAVKSPRIVDWKIHKEGKKSYYQIVRANGKSQMYMIFSQIPKSFDREVYANLHVGREKYPLTPPTLSIMLEKKLIIDYKSEMAYQLLKLIKKQLKNLGSIVGIKSLLDVVGITAA